MTTTQAVLSLLAVAAVATLGADPLVAATGGGYGMAAHAEAPAADALLPGTIVVADTAGDRVRIYHPGGAHAFDIGSRGNGTGEFVAPEGAAIGPNGTIAVADTGNDRIQIFHPNGTFVHAFGSYGTGVGQLAGPAAVAFAPQGDMLAVADTGNHRIYVYHVDGTPAFLFGQPGSSAAGDLWEPRGVAVTSDTMVAVADTGNHRIQIFYVDGTPAHVFGSHGAADGQFDRPHSVGFTMLGDRIVVADTGNNRIQVFQYPPSGQYDREILFDFAVGTRGAADGQFNGPRAAVFDTTGHSIAVADTGNGRIQMLDGESGEFAAGFGSLGTAGGQLGYMQFPASDMILPALPPPIAAWPIAPGGASGGGVGGASGGGVGGASGGGASLPGDVKLRGMFAVADAGNRRVQVFHPNGTFNFAFSGGVNFAGVNVGGFTPLVGSVAYPPDGATIAVVDEFATQYRVQVFNATDGSLMYGVGDNDVPGYVPFTRPKSVAYSPDGSSMAVADYGAGRVLVFDMGSDNFVTSDDLKFVISSAPDSSDFGRPSSASYSQSGDLIIVAHDGNSGARIFSALDGKPVGELGSWGRGFEHYNKPTFMVYSPDGARVAVTDAEHRTVKLFSTHGGHVASSARFASPGLTAYSPDGAVLAVPDGGGWNIGAVKLLHADNGTLIGDFGTPGSGNGQFSNPRSISFAPPSPSQSPPAGMIAVADTFNHRVQVFGADGAVAGKVGSHGNGTGQLDAPASAAYSPDGTRIVVADTGNDRVQVFSVASGSPVLAFGSHGSADGQFAGPAYAAYSPDGTRIVVADTGNDRVLVFYAANGSAAFKLGSHGNGTGQLDAPASAAYSPDGTRIVVADTGNDRVQVFSVASGSPVLAFGSHGSADGQFAGPASAAYSPDGTRIVVADTGNDRVQVFKHDGTFVGAFGLQGLADGQFVRPTSAAYSPDGTRIAVADRDSDRIQVFNAADNTLAFKAGSRGTGDGYFIRPASVSFSGQLPQPMMPGMLAVADSPTNRIKVFYPDGTFAFEFGLNGTVPGDGDEYLQRPQDAAYSPDGTKIATSRHEDGRIQVFNAADGTLHLAFGTHGSGAADVNVTARIAYSPDGKRIAVSDTNNRRIQVFNAADGTHAFSINGTRGNMAYTLPDGEGIAVPYNGTISVFHAANGTLAYTFGTRGNGTGELLRPTAVAYSPDGSAIAVADDGHRRIQVFHAGNHTPAFPFGEAGVGDGQFGNRIMDVAYSTDGTRIAVADRENKRIQVFSAGGTFVGQMGEDSGARLNIPKSVSFAPPPALMPAMPDPEPPAVAPPPPPPLPAAVPGMLAVGGTPGHGVGVYHIANGALAHELDGEVVSYAEGVAYSPDGAKIAVADSASNRIHVFHANGTADFGFTKWGRPLSVDWSPNGTLIAAVGPYSDNVQVFNAASGALVFEFGTNGSASGQFNSPRSVAYSPNGTRIAVADAGNNRVQVFSAGGTFAFEFGTNGGGIGQFRSPTSVAYSPNGANIVVADKNNNRVQVFRAADGAFSFAFGTGGNAAGHFSRPLAVAYSTDGAWIAVADSGNDRVQVFRAADGAFVGAIGSPGDGKFDSPRGVAFIPLPRPPPAGNGTAPLPPPAGNGTAPLPPSPPLKLVVAEIGLTRRVQVLHEDGTFDFKFGGSWGRGNGQFYYQSSIAYSPDGTMIAVADSSRHDVQVFRANSGAFAFKFGGMGSLNGRLFVPYGVTYSPNGTNIAVADFLNDRVSIFTSNGVFVKNLGTEHLDGPHSSAFSPSGDLLAVTDWWNSRVLILNVASGSLVRTIGTGSSWGTAYAVDFSPSGDLIAVSDYSHKRIQVFNVSSGTLVDRFGIGEAPRGIEYRPSGNMIAVSTWDDIHVIDATNGTLVFKIGSGGRSDGQFTGAVDVSYFPLP